MKPRIIDHFGLSERHDISFSEYQDPRDGKKYQTIKIDNIEWFRNNLDFDDTAEFEHSSLIQDVFDAEMPSIKSTGDCGRFYNFYAAQEACPEGWEIPKRSDFIDLFKKIARKEPNEWVAHTKNMIYNTLYGGGSFLGFQNCGFYGYSSYIPPGKKKERSFQGGKSYVFTSTPGSMNNGGSIFIFDPSKKNYIEDVGYDYYPVRPIRKNI